MKQLLTAYAKYDYWANEKILSAVLLLNEEQQKRPIISSFPSVQKTCAHMWDAYRIWWQRLQNEANPDGPTVNADNPVSMIIEHILYLNKQWINWIEANSEDILKAEFAYKNMKGEAFTQPMKDIFLHLCNHGTYHRGQLVTMLRQLGTEQIPQTDYIVYSRV